MRSPKPVTETLSLRDHLQTIVLELEFLTPVFGGGVKVNGHHKPFDPLTPVRVPSIRGQLRFWWRAANPSACTTVQELAEAEANVFGSTQAHSAVAIRVLKQPATPMAERVFLDGERFALHPTARQIAYGAFPLRDPARANQAHAPLWSYPQGWNIEVRFPAALRADVEAALWAWLHFGGLGGRTRRGFGAIRVNGYVHEGKPVKLASVEDGWVKYVKGPSGVAWTRLPVALSPTTLRTRPFADGVEALKHLLGMLQKLRQGNLGRDPGVGPRPGQSLWPEADALRRLFPRPEQHTQRWVVDAFPRSAFGMPIIFEFKNNEVIKTTLLPDGHGRLASRLILRPHHNGVSVEAMALALEQPDPPVLELTFNGGAKSGRLGPVSRAQITTSPGIPPLMVGTTVYTDPVLRYLELV